MLCVWYVKAQLIQQSGDGARLKIRERELQQEVCISSFVFVFLLAVVYR